MYRTSSETISVLWALGLTEAEEGLIAVHAGPSCRVRSLDSAQVQKEGLLNLAEQDDPLLCWLGSAVWESWAEGTVQNAQNQYAALMGDMELVPCVLLLEENPSRSLLEAALDGHFQQVLRAPLSDKHIFEALRRAREARNLMHDLNRMAKEISLSRELLERKSETLDFLLSFFKAVENAASLNQLLHNCVEALNSGMPVHAMHLAWWNTKGNAQLVLDCNAAHGSAAQAWQHFMAENIAHHLPGLTTFDLEQATLCVGKEDRPPQHGKTLLLPLTAHGAPCGLVALHLKEAFLPGRDMSHALDCARSWLALSLEKYAPQINQSPISNVG